jgi:N6-L-threonylcarbamoyladenine synthase
MRILAVETSCDETAVAVLDCSGTVDAAQFTVLGEALFSQASLHAEYGGVYPTLAKREHIKNLPLLLDKALKDAGLSAEKPEIDYIAVTDGPGLEPALWTGIEFANQLSKRWGIPLCGIDHMEGHVVSALVEHSDSTFTLGKTELPLLALLISGGHTELVLMNGWFSYSHIGHTKDDAVGEAFDKVARMLGLEYPGGPKIAEHAARSRARGTKHGITFPRPLAHEASCNFSFSGLKTAVLYKLKEMGDLSDDDKEHIAEEFENAARDVIVLKTKRALEETGSKTLAVGGGVSANIEIRKGLESLITNEFPDVRIAYPPSTLHLDNAIMIGIAAYLRLSAQAPLRVPSKAEGSRSLTTN